MDKTKLTAILDKHKKWLTGEAGGEPANLSYANLSSADLSFANLSSADLSYADISFANLSYANLSFADLSYADLSYANLSSADLSFANLSSADLSYADISSADLSSAKLGDHTTMTCGETWRQYLDDVLPSLLTAGGKSMEEVANDEHWQCHSWKNCPMAAAFGVTSEQKTPLLLRPRVKEFVQLFDAGLIPCPKKKGA